MSGCERFGADLGAWIDGELEAAAAGAFEAHLADCPACARALEAFRDVDRGLAALPRIAPSTWFEARFWARLARAPSPRRGWRRGLVPALAGAGLLALLWLVAPGDPALPERDWEVVAMAEDFDLLLDEDLEILWELDALEAWDDSGES